MSLGYYLRRQGGHPVLDELLAQNPLLGESLAMNAQMAHDLYFATGNYPKSIVVDRFITTEERVACSKHGVKIYETYFTNPIGAVTFLSTFSTNRQSVALAVGHRNSNVATQALGNFPYLDDSINRTSIELGVPAEEFQWERV